MKTKIILPADRLWIVTVTLLGLALGGATSLGTECLVTSLAAMILLLAPPRNSLGPLMNILFPAFFVISLVAFLPAAWFAMPPWRQHLTNDLQLPLPVTLTAQPWLTLQGCALLLVGLTWAYYLLSLRWTRDQRIQATGLLVFGVAVLSAVAVGAYVFGWHVPGWNQEDNRGWFPNRNQTADVLALAGIVNYALISDCLRRREVMGGFWLATLPVIGAGLIVSYSRSGVILFFLGIAIWHLWPSARRRSLKWTLLGLSLVFALLTLFFLFGGDTLQRFQDPASPSATVVSREHKADFRLALQKDALRFSAQLPWTGVGLGNFSALFATARVDSISQSRALHPESDWLWAACEMGWPAVLLLLAGIIWWLVQCFPFESGKRGESLRRAAAVAVIMFIAHGLVDVAGHRIGSLWFALLLASLALPTVDRADSFEPYSLVIRRPVATVLSSLAAVMLLICGWWVLSLMDLGGLLPPTTADLDRLKLRIPDAATEKQVDQVHDLASEALRIAPLDWTLYFQRAWAEVFQPAGLTPAATDFLAARALEPLWALPCYHEGAIWLSANQPDRCMDAWEEALRRDPASRHDLFVNMINLSESNPLVRDSLCDFAGKDLNYLMIFLDSAMPNETREAIARLLNADPTLSTLNSARRSILFAAWWQKGDQAALGAELLSHPDWQNEGWPWLAQFYAQQKDFQRAWQTVAAHASPPDLPTDTSNLSPADLEHSYYANPGNTPAGLVLLAVEIKAGNLDDALDVARTLEKNSDHPPSVFYYEGEAWANKGQWELAWDAWNRYDAAQ